MRPPISTSVAARKILSGIARLPKPMACGLPVITLDFCRCILPYSTMESIALILRDPHDAKTLATMMRALYQAGRMGQPAWGQAATKSISGVDVGSQCGRRLGGTHRRGPARDSRAPVPKTIVATPRIQPRPEGVSRLLCAWACSVER